MASYDVERLKSIASRYQGFGENKVQQISVAQAPPARSQDFIGNIGKSIGNLGKSAIGAVGSGLRQTFWNEPGNLIKSTIDYNKSLFQNAQKTIGIATGARERELLKKGFRPDLAKKYAQAELGGLQSQAFLDTQKNPFNPLSSEYYKKTVPVGATAITLAGGFAPKTALSSTNFGTRLLTDTFGIGKTFGKSVPVNIAGKVARTQLLVKPTLQDVSNLPSQISQGKYGEAALNAALLGSGGLVKGPIGTIVDIASKTKTLISPAFKSGQGVFDLVKIKNGESVMQAFNKISAPQASKTNTENTLKVFQDYLVQQWGDAKTASKALSEYIGDKDLSKMSLTQLTKELENFRTSDEAIKQTAIKLAKKGLLTDAAGKKISADQAKYVGAVRSPGGSTDDLIVKLSTTSDAVQAKKAIAKFAKENPAFVKIPQNKRVLQGIEESGVYGDEAITAVKDRFISTKQVLFGGKAKVSPEGYTAGLRTGTRFSQAADVAELQTGKNGVLAPIGSALSKLGISPESSSQGQARFVSEKIKSNFDAVLTDLGVNRPAKEIINKLRTFANTKKGVFDIRQLTSKEITQALKIDVKDAKTIKKAYKKAVSSLSVEERGLAGKLTDINLNINPLAAPYSRVQNTFKYEMNPFFSIQERIETRAGVAALTGTTRRPRADYTKQVEELNKLKFWEYSGFGGEGADVGNIANITSKLKRGQKETLSAGIEALANKQGKTITEFVSDPKNADILQDFKTVVQYPDKGFTSSNLSKMLNLIVFPTRYNIKITQFAIKQLAKQPGVVQSQVLRGIYDYNQFMESPDGIRFKADNKEVLSLLNYFTPLNNIQQIMNVLSGKAKTPSDFGLIGGLPFGIISQALQGQGVIQTDTPYVDPATGEIYPDRVPVTTKARTYKLLADIIGTMYNYPGRQAGAPKGFAKKDLNELFPRILFGEPKTGDFESITRTNVSPEDAKKIQVLQGSPSDLGKLMAPAPGIKPIKVNRLTEEDIIKGMKFAKPKKLKKQKPRPIPVSQLLNK